MLPPWQRQSSGAWGVSERESEILFARNGRLGLVCLNRPRALNALTESMCLALHRALVDWRADPDISAVLIEGAGEKAFCAGGDVVKVARAAQAGEDGWRGFFIEEYRMNAAIARFPKPYIAFLDGVTMGGGVGISVHGDFRIATERTLFAMPETALGLIPDVGGSYFLPRLPGATGCYLGLTGYRARAADCLLLGIATHFIPSDRLGEAKAALAGSDGNALDHQGVASVLQSFTGDPGEAPLAARRAQIDLHFGQPTLDDILASLAADKDAWAQETLAALMAMSPASLALSFETMRRGAGLGLEDCLRMEFRVVSRIVREDHDFHEGVRAILIDKDRNPKWSPARLAEIDAGFIVHHFESLGEDELVLGPGMAMEGSGS